MNEYDKQANDFLSKHGIKFEYTNLGTSHKWGMTRYAYEAVFTRKVGGGIKTMTINFWGSGADYMAQKDEIRAYDVLSCLSGEHVYRTIKDIVSEFGKDAADMDIKGILQEARKLRAFFTPAMLDGLSDIQ